MPFHLRTARRKRKRVGWRQALDISKNRGPVIVVQSEQQKIPDCRFIQFISHARMQPQTIERIAAEKDSAELRVVKRLDTKVIARAKEFFELFVPDCEGKIAPYVINATFSPCRVRLQNQFAIRRGWLRTLRFVPELFDQLVASIQARIRHNPIAFCEPQRLPLIFRFVRGSQKRVTHSNRLVHPDVLAIRSAKREKIRERL